MTTNPVEPIVSHTPGPWRYTPDDGSYITDCTQPEWGQRIVAQMHGDPNKSEVAANAHLIAAAPDLLAACRIAHRMLGKTSQPKWPATADVWAVLRDAIAKAEGRS